MKKPLALTILTLVVSVLVVFFFASIYINEQRAETTEFRSDNTQY